MVKMKSIKAIFRRGQQTSKPETQTPEDLSRSSSVTNLNVEQKAKGAKPKKADSKDKLDKVAERKNDRSRALNKNNNREAENSQGDSETLQKQLTQMANDKSNLALQLGEQTGQLKKLQNEIMQMKMLQEESAEKLQRLVEENTILRNRLRDVAHSPLSDSEKQQLLYESHRHHSSAPASIATNLVEDGGDITTCPTPEWDKHSSSNVSEISVACLQDKINQMQETHYSTNEELQATLQELTDLQKQLTELQQENLRINDEKNLMFESLCRQTERLKDSRNEVESLKQLLYQREEGEETSTQREQKLVDLLQSAQEERDTLLMKQERLDNELEDSRSENLHHSDKIAQLSERVTTLESILDAKHAEHKLLDQELAQAKDQCSNKQIEIDHLKDLLENARTKINEFEQNRTVSDKSELDELLDNARKEKDALESEIAHLKEKLALSKNENEKLKEQLSILQEECKVTRNNAKMTQSDLQYKLEKAAGEKIALTEQLQQFQEAVNELQVQTQCQVEDKRQLSTVLSETQRNLNESERRIEELENELSELKKTKKEQEEEWEKFQNDLLTSVRVANDFKTEAQQDLQKLIMENKAGREKIKQLEAQIEKLKGGSDKSLNLSNEDALISSLKRRYKEIEGLSDADLTEEQKAIKVLKLHYDREFPRSKPVAHKPKDKLAISKPLLESVISNPKLKKIVRNSKLPNVESVTYFSDDEQRKSVLPVRESLMDSVDLPVDEIKRKASKAQSDSISIEKSEEEEEFERSQSLPDLPKALMVEHEGFANVSKKEERGTVNLALLEKICDEIDANTPEDELTKEQKLALRLRENLKKEGKKTTLKKKSKLDRKKIIISRPTPESVEKDLKLRGIINDPGIRKAGVSSKEKKKIFEKNKARRSMPVSPLVLDDSLKRGKKSRSYNDISFKFQIPNMYSEQNEEKFDGEIVFKDQVTKETEDKSVFKTFQINNNTFKKEHNFLDRDDSRDNEEIHEKDGGSKKDIKNTLNEEIASVAEDTREKDRFKTEGDFLDKESHLDKEEDKNKNVELSSRSTDETDNVEIEKKYFDKIQSERSAPRGILKTPVSDVITASEDSTDNFAQEKERFENDDFTYFEEQNQEKEKENAYFETDDLENVNAFEDEGIIDDSTQEIKQVDPHEIIAKYIEVEDDKLFEDDEEREARRGTRQRYSQVIEEIKDKFDNSDDKGREKEEEFEGMGQNVEDLDEYDRRMKNLEDKVTEEEFKEIIKRIEDLNEPNIGMNYKHASYDDLTNEELYKTDAIDLRPKRYDESGQTVDSLTKERKSNELNDIYDVPFEILSQDFRKNKNDKEYDSDHNADKIQENEEDNIRELELTNQKREHDSKDSVFDVHDEKKFDQGNLEDVILRQNGDNLKHKKNDLSKDSMEKPSSEEKQQYSDGLQDVKILAKSEENFEKILKKDDPLEVLTPTEKEIVERYSNEFDKNDTPKLEDVKILQKSEETFEEILKKDASPEVLTPTEKETVERYSNEFDKNGKSEDVKILKKSEETLKKNDSPEVLTPTEKELVEGYSNEFNRNDKSEDVKILSKPEEILKKNDPLEALTPTEAEIERFSNEFDKNYRLEDVKNLTKSEETYEEIIERYAKKFDKKFKEHSSKHEEDIKDDVSRNSIELTPSETEVIERYSDELDKTDEKSRNNETIELTPKEKQLIEKYSTSHKNEDVTKRDSLTLHEKEIVQRYSGNWKDETDNIENRTFPAILTPTKLNRSSTYEPVYENFYITSNKESKVDSNFSGKKPVATPRINSLDEPTFTEFGGQIRKTRFSIIYDRKKGDSFKERNQEKKARVRDLKEMFERKSVKEFSSLVNKALEDDR